MTMKTARPACVVIALLASAAAVTGCFPPPSPPPPGGAVNVSARYAFDSDGAEHCTGSLTWTYTPLSLTGQSGRATQIIDSKTYDIPPSGAECTFGSGEMGLRQGTWRIQGDAAGTCVVTLTADTSVTFRQGAAGCTRFP